MPNAINRDGGDKMVKLAKGLVFLVQTFAVKLKTAFPPPSAVSTLVDAILALSPLLTDAEMEVLDIGGTNEEVVLDPENIPGTNASIAEYEEPE